MNKIIIIIIGFLSLCVTSPGQARNARVLYIIDSIPLLTDPEKWNQILQEDIADYSVITNRDSLTLLGWPQVDGVAYIFTKAYRNRPDSIKSIPSLKQMVMKDGAWMLHGRAYSGKYIDYYNNGKVQNQGTLLNGKINGELIVFYKTGIRKSVTNFKDNIRHGPWIDYYKNGALRRMDEYINGMSNRGGKSYFINGQVMHELRLKNATDYDTSVSYYSTGKVREMTMTKTGEFHPGKKQADMNYHTTMFYQHLRTGDIKAANKNFLQIWLMDSSGIDTYFKEGLLAAHEFRFDEAIAKFDIALAKEPLMREALEQRGLARIKKFQFQNLKIALKDRKFVALTLYDFKQLPAPDKARVCDDILLADDIDPDVNYNNKTVPDDILNYCKQMSGR